MRELGLALLSGNYHQTYSADWIKDHKDQIDRTTISKGKYSYDIPQVELATNVAKTLGYSMKEILSFSEQFANADKLTPEENLKNWERFDEIRENLKNNLKKLKEKGIEEISLEPSWIQAFGANMAYHGARQYADARQLPLIALGHIAGGATGKYLLNSAGANISPAAKQAFEIFSKATGEMIESGFEEYADQLATEDVIDPQTIFYSALGSFVFSGALQTGGKLIGNKLAKADIETQNELSPRKEMDRVIKSGQDKKVLKAKDLNVIADDVAKTSIAFGKPMSKSKIMAKNTMIEGVDIDKALNVYVPTVLKKVVERIGKASDDIQSIRSLVKNIEENPSEFIKVIDDILVNEKLSNNELNAFNWAKVMADTNKIKEISFSDDILENSYGLLKKKKSSPKVEEGIDMATTKDAETIAEKSSMEKAKKKAVQNIAKKFGLNDTDINNKKFTQKAIALLKDVGERVKRKYNLKTKEDVINFYKNKYGVDFSTEYVDDFVTSPDRLAELNILEDTITGQRKYVININSMIEDEDLEIGALRHELEHLRDFIEDENFNSKNPEFIEGETIGESINNSYRGHFKNYQDGSFEISYILNDEINNILDSKGKPNMKVIRNLGLDIPKALDQEGMEHIGKLVENSKEMTPEERLKYLRRETSKYFSLKRKIKSALLTGKKPYQKAQDVKDVISTEILIPFERAEDTARSRLISMWTFDIDGNTMSPEKIIDKFVENNCDIVDYMFFDGELTDGLKPYQSQLETLKLQTNRALDEMVVDGVVSKEGIINTLCWDNRLVLERYLSEEELAKNMNRGELDIDNVLSGKSVADELTGTDIQEKVVPIRDRFAENEFENFQDAFEELQVKVNSDYDVDDMIRTLKRAKKFTKSEDLKNFILGNGLEQVEEIRDFLTNNKDFFRDNAKLFDGSEKSMAKLEELRINSKKENAKIFFTEDMSSVKGTEKNPAKGTYAHKLSRFELYIRRGIMTEEQISNLVKSQKISGRATMNKMFKDVPVSLAIKKVFPQEGYKGMASIISSLQREITNPSLKTTLREIENYIDSHLGEKLGHITKPNQTIVDKFIQGLLNVTNRINLTGPKAFLEMLQEPTGMVRDNILLYGGEGFLTEYKEILKSIVTTMNKGDDLHKINLSIGDLKQGSIPLEMFNIVMDELDDITGYKKERIMKYGTKGDRIFYGFNTVTDKVNLYSLTQRYLKLTAHKLAANNIDRISKYVTMEEVYKNNTHYLNNVLKSLGFEDVDLKILRRLEETESFNERNIFDKDELSKIIRKDMYDEFLKDNISIEEFSLRKQLSMEKIEKLYNRIVKDISPTETSGAMRSRIDLIEDPIHRNFVRLTSNFKNSIQTQWQRMYKAYYFSNVTDEGKFDWSNKVWQQRMMRKMVNTGVFLSVASLITDKDFYLDPIGEIENRIDELVDNPESVLWSAFEEQTNLWGLMTGSSAVRRPVQLINQVADREYKKAGITLLKGAVNTSNLQLSKSIYEVLKEISD